MIRDLKLFERFGSQYLANSATILLD